METCRDAAAAAGSPAERVAEVQQRTRARRKIFQRVCSGLMGLSFLLLIGFTGGVEQGGHLVAGAIGMGLSLAGFALFGTLAGIIQW